MWEHFPYRWNHNRDAVPKHVIDYVNRIVAEVDEFGYAVWQEHRYAPPSFIDGNENRQRDHSAYEYQIHVAGLGITLLSKINRRVRDIHKHYRYNKNVFYRNPFAKEALQLIQSQSHKY
jgi:hypothetical protein